MDDKIDQLIYSLQALAILFFLSFFLVNFSVIYQIDVWRHDSFYYATENFSKLGSEGRWLNFLFWDFLKLINPHLSILFILTSIAYFAFTAANRVVDSKPYSLIISLIIIQIPFLGFLVGWPATSLAAFAVLGLATYFSDRLPISVFMVLFACLFLGTVSNFFFLMPLLFLSQSTVRKFLQVLLIWMAAFVVGYFCAEIITFFLTFEFIRISEWRNPNPAHSFRDVWDNSNRAFMDFFNQSELIINLVNSKVALAALFMLLIHSLAKDRFLAALTCFIAGIAVYVTVIPVGVIVSSRTAFTYWVCLVFMFLVKERMSRAEKISLLVMAILMGGNTALAHNNSLKWYEGVTNSLKMEIAQSLPLSPIDIDTISVSMDNDQIERLVKTIEQRKGLHYITGEGFDEAKRIVPMVTALGFRNVNVCTNCSSLYSQIDRSNEIGSSAMFRTASFTSGEVVIFINQEFLN